MAAMEANKSACGLVQVGTLTLERRDNRDLNYTSLMVLSPEMVMVVDCEADSLRLYNLKNGHLLAAYDTLTSTPQGTCICSIHDTEITVALCLLNSQIEILGIKTTEQTVKITVMKTLNVRTQFDYCYGVKYRNETLLILGKKLDNMFQYNLCWGIVPITGSNLGKVHEICRCEVVNWSYLSLNPRDDNMVYISYWARNDFREGSGVYGYRNDTRDFVYRHNDLVHPTGMTVDRLGFIFICNMDPDYIFQLTEKGQLVTILKEGIPSSLQAIFFEEQEGLLYFASWNSNIIPIYIPVYSDQQGHSSSRVEDELNTKGELDESDRMEKSGYGSLEETSKPADDERATRNVFEASLNELISHLQNSIQRKLKEKRMACIIQWKARVYPETVIQAAEEIDNAKHDGKWEECLQKTNAILELIQTLPKNEIPDKQELLVNIYCYFGPTLVDADNFSMANGFDKKEWINAIEELLKTLPDEKYPYEAALLYFEITIRDLALHESFKSRSLTAARKANDYELQLYGSVLFVLAEWMANNIDIGPAKQRDYFCRVAFEMDRSLQLAKYLDDKVATKVIQKILQEVEVRCKRPFLDDIDSWMKRQLSKSTNHLWMENREEETFNLATESTEETQNLASFPNGSSLHSLEVKDAISRGDVVYLQNYLNNREWEHEDELLDCFNYSLDLKDSHGNQTMAKVILSWICNELTKLHQPYNVSVWAASISRKNSISKRPVLICNYGDDLDEKFMDKCFFGFPVIYREYNTVNEEEQSVQSSQIFLESNLTQIDAIRANEIVSLKTDWLMKSYSNLEVIKPCPVRSVCLEIKKETCIVLYCRMKGFIPFGENQFPTTLSAGEMSFPVDVREGFYVPAMFQESTDVVHDLGQYDSRLFRMGFSMGPYDKDISATVGPFVQIDENDVGFLTCAHAFGIPSNIYMAFSMPVVQPAKGEFAPVNPVPADESICGYVDNIKFDIDSSHPVNVDAALIRLKREKIPNRGRFAWMNSNSQNEAGITTGQSLSFDHGEIIRKEHLEQVLSNHGKILKFGAASGVTSSKFYPGRVVIRIGEGQLNHEHGQYFPPINEGTRCYFMRGQYLIQSRSDNVFLRPGDSGSGVFYMDERQRLFCIGIAIGYLASSYEAVVTPIEDVLEALELDSNNLMQFPEHYIYQREEWP